MKNNQIGNIGGRGDPSVNYGSRGDPPLIYGSRGDPAIRYGSRGDPSLQVKIQGNPPVRYPIKEEPIGWIYPENNSTPMSTERLWNIKTMGSRRKLDGRGMAGGEGEMEKMRQLTIRQFTI